MKEEDSNPLEPVGDEPIEARIVAWVLGDASAFEAAELERLCAESPELEVFRRRMISLHGLLAEAGATGPEDAWKLPADKREKVEALFGTAHGPATATLLKPKRKGQPWIRQALMASAACLVLAAGFRYVFEPSKESSSQLAANSSISVMSARKTAAWSSAGRDLPMAEGYASSQPVLPEIADLESESKSLRSELLPARPLEGGIDIVGGSPFKLSTDSSLASNDRQRTAGRKRQDAAADERAGAVSAQDASRVLAKGKSFAAPPVASAAPAPQPSAKPFGGPAEPDPAAAAADPFAALAAKDSSNTVFNSPIEGTTVPAIPAPAKEGPNIVAGGLRSGDGAITRNNIDAVLNNPNRVAEMEARRGATEARAAKAKTALDQDEEQAVPETPVAKSLTGLFDDVTRADMDRGRSLGEASLGTDVAAEWPGLTLSNGVWYGSLGNGSSLDYGYSRIPDHYSERDVYGEVSEDLGIASMTPPFVGAWSNAGAPHDAPADSLLDSDKDAAAGEGVGGGRAYGGGLAQREMVRRREAVAEGDKLAAEGQAALDRGDYQAGVEQYKKALEATPDAPVLGDRRETLTGKYADGVVALAEKYRKGGKYDEAKKVLDEAAKSGLAEANPKLQQERNYFNDPIRNNPVPTVEGTQNVEKLRKEMYVGEGAYNLGKYDEAKRHFEDVLRIDPYNSAARRYMEKIAEAKSDYYRAAYDHTRAELLMQVDRAWEASAPDESKPASVGSLKKSVQDQEDNVEEKRKLLTNIVRTKGIILTDQQSLFRNELGDDDRGATSARDTANKLEQEKIQLESQIQTLSKYDSDQLLTYAAGLNLPENVIKTLYPQYLEQQKLVSKLKADGLDSRHPDVVAQNEVLKKMKQQLDEGTTNVKETLRAQLTLADDRLAKVRMLSDAKQESAINRAIDSTDYLQAKNDLEGAQAKLAALKKQLATAEAATPAAPKPAPIPTDETVAAAEPFSTFSLHVSDASFKLAKAALDRGERLSPDQIRTEEFYNAFDYGDPAPAPGEAVACTIEQAAHPVLPQRNIVRVAMRVGSAGRGQGQPLNLTLLLDNSGSMERDDRHEGLKAAIAQLASLLQPGDTVTLAGFSRTPHLLADRLPGTDAAKLVELVDKLPSEGGTNLEEALKLAGELAVQRKNPAAQNRIVLLTDGAANLGNAQPEDLAEKVAALRQQGIAFDAAGIGAGGLNDRMLEALTRHGNGRYYIVNDPKDADANFAKQLAGAFRPAAGNVKVQVHFNPNRVSHYKLIGFEKHRLNTEDFHNDAVDAAELAADEAGVALYQVETLPDGSGEIGEVSVRFRDTAAGKMVENTWTIPHDEKTPAFDQARPSIQLATLAMLAAEKLRGGPLADVIDFTNLSPVISRVKNYYKTSSRVGELTDMTGKLR
ncbi:MAG: von Willebrand factor type A domain-containing protein [Luteolibacter sp.]